MYVAAHSNPESPETKTGKTCPLRVLHLLGAQEDHGGVLTVLRSIEEASRPLGWQNLVVVHNGYEETRLPQLKYLFSKHLVDECANHLRLLIHTARAWPEIRRLLKHQPFDIVHGQSRGSLGIVIWMAAVLRRPVVYTFHARANRTGLYRWAASLKHFHSVLIAEDMVEYYQLPPNSPRVTVVPSACAQHFFEGPLAYGQHRRDPRCKFRMVGIGSLVRWKNWDFIPQAIAALPDTLRHRVEFHHWGQTLGDADSLRYAGELDNQIKSLNLRDQIFLHGPTTEIARVLEDADWLVHPTTNEPAGLVIAEAIAMGVPALVSASGGPKYTVTPGKNGLHFQPGNIPDLAAKLADILEGRAEGFLPEKLRESVRSRSAVEMVNSLAKVYSACTPVQG